MTAEKMLADFGAKIKQLRKMNGWTQRELAEKCGYNSANSHSTINKIESGKSDIPITKLLTLAEVFGVSAAYLLGEDEAEAKNLAQQNAMHIMDRKLSENEKKALMAGLELYFQSKGTGENGNA